VQLDDLYQEIILDHYKHPRHFAKIPADQAMVDEENPTCGDHIKLTAAVAAGRLSDVKIECEGCAICTASSSMMAEKVIGQKVTDIHPMIARFNEMMRGGVEMSDDELGDLIALKGVRKYPLRIKCCTMAWHGLEVALKQLNT
jgi:nitrogen fixation protein NifU and related proteins